MSHVLRLQSVFNFLMIHHFLKKVCCDSDIRTSLKYSADNQYCYNVFDANQCSFLQFIVSSLTNLHEENTVQKFNKIQKIKSSWINHTEQMWREIINLKEKIESVEENHDQIAQSRKLRQNNVKDRNKSRKRYLTGRSSNQFQNFVNYMGIDGRDSNDQVSQVFH